MESKHFSHHHPLTFHQMHQGSQTHCSGCKTSATGNVYVCWHCSYFLHEQCFHATRSLKHPSHPLHPLSLVPLPTYPSSSFFCNSCNLAGDGFSYSCSACEFDIHVHCALIANPNPNPNPHPLPSHNYNINPPHPHENPIYPPPIPIQPYPPQPQPTTLQNQPQNYTPTTYPPPTPYPQPNPPPQNYAPSAPNQLPPPNHNPPPNQEHYPPPNPPPQNYAPPASNQPQSPNPNPPPNQGHYLQPNPPPQNYAPPTVNHPPPPNPNSPTPTYSTVVNAATTTAAAATSSPPPPPSSIIKHFSHPHVLKKMEIDQKKAKVCSACECELSGTAYCCTEPYCTFNLHKSCFDSPQELRHKSHLEHPLTLLTAPPYNDGFTCNACLKDGKAFAYNCAACSYDLHIDCVQWPDTVHRPDHKHDLTLYYSSPAAAQSGEDEAAFMCDVCRNPVHEMAWVYYCRECDFGTHLECVASGIQQESGGGGAAKTEDELIREVELKFAVLQLLLGAQAQNAATSAV